MKFLIIGSKGMLGTDLVELSIQNHEVLAWDFEDIDITRSAEMSKIQKEKPDIIINCAAYTNVDLAETEKEKCYAVNVIGVKNLVNISKKLNLLFTHISTDYVFNGEKESYCEDDLKDPINYYGKTKAEGEDLIINNLEKYFIIRTAWLIGKNGQNFVETMKKLMNEKAEIKVVNDQIGKPTFTKDLSKGIINLIESEKEYGIYHLTNEGRCSWFEFAQEIKKLINSNQIIIPCNSKQFPRPAKRPKFSVLNNNKTHRLRSWKEPLKEYLGE